jgi:ribosomal protein L11 methyltransferase
VRYIEIITTAPGRDADRIADILHDVTGGGIWIETPFSQHDLESDAVVATEGAYTIHAYFPADTDRGDVLLAARRRLTEAGIESEIEARLVADEDWAEAWKEHFHVERYGERLVVVPSWRTHHAVSGDVVLKLDPGMAFGTGQHETTRMCLEALERAVSKGSRVLDVGCGSGILSIAAAKLGATEVWAVDVDPICVRVTEENAAANSLSVRVGEGSMGASWPFPASPLGGFDVIVANIIARPIIEMAADFAAALRPGGRLILSGIIGEREGDVIEALEQQRLLVDSVRALGEWRCIEAVRA